MSSGLRMNSPKTIVMIAVLALIMLLVCPTQSRPTDDNSDKLSTRQKRWTFNTWRLHGRRQLSNGSIFLSVKQNLCLFIFLVDLYSPKTLLSPSNAGYQYQVFNDEDDMARKIHEHLLQIFPELNRV